MADLNLTLEGTHLQKASDFPDVVGGGKDCYTVKVLGLPSGATSASLYTSLSWESGTKYETDLTVSSTTGSATLDEYFLAIPDEDSDYVDYTIKMSVVYFVGDVRYTTDIVDIPVVKSNYSSTTSEPAMPKSKYDELLDEIDEATTSMEVPLTVSSLTIKVKNSDGTWSTPTTTPYTTRKVFYKNGVFRFRMAVMGGSGVSDGIYQVAFTFSIPAELQDKVGHTFSCTGPALRAYTTMSNYDTTASALQQACTRAANGVFTALFQPSYSVSLTMYFVFYGSDSCMFDCYMDTTQKV